MATICCGSRTYTEIQAVLFDKDGTLADSAPYLRKLGRYRAEAIASQVSEKLTQNAQGLPDIEHELLRAFGFRPDGFRLDSDRDSLNPAGMLAVSSRQETTTAAAAYVAATGRDWHEAVAIAQNAFKLADAKMPRKAETTVLFPGARDLLWALHQANVKLGIISADITPNIDDFVDCQHLEGLIELTWGNDKPIAKPDPEAYRAVCKTLGVPPENTLMLGDAEGDMTMARGAGAAGTIGVLWGWPGAEPLALADVNLRAWSEIQVLEGASVENFSLSTGSVSIESDPLG